VRAALLVVLAAAMLAGGYLGGRAVSSGDEPSAVTRTVPVTSTVTETPTVTATQTETETATETQVPPPPAPRPAITQDPIPYTTARRGEMAAYALRHYGVATSRLTHPRLVVLHFTASSSYPGVHAAFANDTPNNGELPGTCAHFVVDKDGTIYQQAPLDLMCRHAIGVNDRSIGIEMVQETGPSSSWADQQILARPAQIHSVLALTAWLCSRYGIPVHDVIGHSMVNDSPFFRDNEGWRNDHTDWQPPDVARVRAMLRARYPSLTA
jgi:hypothetical protein